MKILSDEDYFATLEIAIGRLVFARENRVVTMPVEMVEISDILDDLTTYAMKRDDAPTLRREGFRVIEGTRR